MTSCLEQNINRQPTGYRYSEDVKLYAAYLRMIGGKMNYETFKANAKHSVPCVKSIDRYITQTKSNATEGVLRTEELLKYLTDLRLPKIVSLSEDATRITGRIQYNSKTNQLVGFVLPLEENGMPMTDRNRASSAAAMEECFYDIATGKENICATYLNVVMAQPLVSGVPAFCLLLFGSDDAYTASQVQKRWQFITNELKKKNIEVLAFGSDSAPKYNSVMRSQLELGRCPVNSINFPEWFNANLQTTDAYLPIQDIVHIGTKFRNQLLKNKLKMGKYDVSVNHLSSLIENFTKEKHNLCLLVIKPKDRQNFDSVLRICDDKVIELLRNIEGSEGTILYLRVMSSVLRSFLDSRLTPIEAIRHIWFANFILRIWERFILQTRKKYNVEEHFVTMYCRTCVEINAHSIVFLIMRLKERKLDHLFQPQMLGSQPCESIFRQIRSMTSTYSTVTNCSLLDM